MKTSQNVLNLVSEYRKDPNCRADLWIDDCLSHGEVTEDERNEFLMIILVTTYQRVYQTTMNQFQRAARLNELLTWDTAWPGKDRAMEHAAKVKALQNLLA